MWKAQKRASLIEKFAIKWKKACFALIKQILNSYHNTWDQKWHHNLSLFLEFHYWLYFSASTCTHSYSRSKICNQDDFGINPGNLLHLELFQDPVWFDKSKLMSHHSKCISHTENPLYTLCHHYSNLKRYLSI